MSPPVILRFAAEADVLLAAEWYETRAPGLGAAFGRAVDACLSLIQRHPEGFQVVASDVRRARLRRFPFSVYYVAREQSITVIAVLHVRRDPREWQHRLEQPAT